MKNNKKVVSDSGATPTMEDSKSNDTNLNSNNSNDSHNNNGNKNDNINSNNSNNNNESNSSISVSNNVKGDIVTPKNVMISIGSELLTGYPENNEVNVGSKLSTIQAHLAVIIGSTSLILFSGISDNILYFKSKLVHTNLFNEGQDNNVKDNSKKQVTHNVESTFFRRSLLSFFFNVLRRNQKLYIFRKLISRAFM